MSLACVQSRALWGCKRRPSPWKCIWPTDCPASLWWAGRGRSQRGAGARALCDCQQRAGISRPTSASPSTSRQPICPRTAGVLTCRLPWASWRPAGKSMPRDCPAGNLPGELSLSGSCARYAARWPPAWPCSCSTFRPAWCCPWKARQKRPGAPQAEVYGAQHLLDVVASCSPPPHRRHASSAPGWNKLPTPPARACRGPPIWAKSRARRPPSGRWKLPQQVSTAC